MGRRKTIAVIGGGITGLSTAYYLQKELRQQQREADLVVLEASHAFGGRIRTKERDGFRFELGPDSFLSRKTAALELVRELKLEEELTGTNPSASRSYILHKNRLHRMPEGMVLGIPSRLKPFWDTDLLTLRGKLRALLDLVLPAKTGKEDESLGQFIERRLGKEVVLNIAEPLLSGIYAEDVYTLSIQATFPSFVEMERQYGSLIRATMANSKKQVPTLPGQAAANKSMFLSFRNGLETLIHRLEAVLAEQQVVLRSQCPVTRMEPLAVGRYLLTINNTEQLEADAVVLTLPTYQAAKLVSHPALSQMLSSIEYVSVANLVFAFRREEIRFPLEGSGFVIPRTERRFITACTWTSEKWLHTCSREYVLMRCYVGRAGAEEWMGMADEEIVNRVRMDLRDIMGIDATPLFTELTRLPQSMPQYHVDHLKKVATFRTLLRENMPHVWMTGAAFYGVGIPDCIRQGKETAMDVAAALSFD